jgi:hypothetical protein
MIALRASVPDIDIRRPVRRHRRAAGPRPPFDDDPQLERALLRIERIIAELVRRRSRR